MSLACAQCPVRDSAACSALAPDERDELAQSGRVRTLARGETLFAAGDEATTCATLVRGALKITHASANGDERILALVHPAGFVGELFQPFSRHDVVALTDSELCIFSGERFNAAVARHPELAHALLRRTQEDLYAGRELLALVGSGSAAGRVAGILLALARAASDSPCHPAQRFDLPLTRGEIAIMLGLKIETVSRTLTRFAREGAIRREGARGIVLLDPARLAELAEGLTG